MVLIPVTGWSGSTSATAFLTASVRAPARFPNPEAERTDQRLRQMRHDASAAVVRALLPIGDIDDRLRVILGQVPFPIADHPHNLPGLVLIHVDESQL